MTSIGTRVPLITALPKWTSGSTTIRGAISFGFAISYASQAL
jgi:hypothetical protein